MPSGIQKKIKNITRAKINVSFSCLFVSKLKDTKDTKDTKKFQNLKKGHKGHKRHKKISKFEKLKNQLCDTSHTIQEKKDTKIEKRTQKQAKRTLTKRG